MPSTPPAPTSNAEEAERIIDSVDQVLDQAVNAYNPTEGNTDMSPETKELLEAAYKKGSEADAEIQKLYEPGPPPYDNAKYLGFLEKYEWIRTLVGSSPDHQAGGTRKRARQRRARTHRKARKRSKSAHRRTRNPQRARARVSSKKARRTRTNRRRMNRK